MATQEHAHSYAVIMAGGGGTRLWPASRRRRAKQFLALGAADGQTLIGATVRRVEPVCGLERVVVVAAADQVPYVRRALPELPEANLLAEPCGRNTAPCVGLAAEAIAARDPDAVLAVLPADHYIGDEPAFVALVDRALAVARQEQRIVTLGVQPSRPETGYGYIQMRAEPFADGVYEVAAFVEKPDAATAEQYLASGRYLWNSGMFFFTARQILAELRRHLPEARAPLDELRAAFCAPSADHTATIAQAFPRMPSISIDYGVMEKATGILVLPGEFGWNDVGSWTALADTLGHDDDGNTILGPTLLHDSRGNVVVSEAGHLIALHGVDDLVVVATEDAILVCPRARAQEVRQVVAELGQRGLDRYL